MTFISGAPQLIELDGFNAYYGDFQALFDVSLTVNKGETVSLVGANGAGKSTLLNSLMGFTRFTASTARFQGEPIQSGRVEAMARRGISIVPEGRRVLPGLSVRENIEIGRNTGRNGDWTVERVLEVFPILAEFANRPAALLSGGQQQMIAIGRALVSNPELLLLDEISLGLAPIVVDDVYAALSEVLATTSVLLVEQDIDRALANSDRFYCLLGGRVSLEGTSATTSKEDLGNAYFGTTT